MALINKNTIMSYGGIKGGNLNDGVLFDTDTKQVTQTVNSGGIKFDCQANRHCITEYGAVVAFV